MFGVGAAEIVVGVVLLLAAEVVLFWAASALVEVPAMTRLKLVLVVLLVVGVSLALTAAIALYSGLGSPPLSPENRMHALLVSVAGLVVSLVVSALLYAPLLSVSFPRGVLLAVFQVLLRAFLYALVVAALMVALALYQIWSGADARGAAPSPPSATLPS